MEGLASVQLAQYLAPLMHFAWKMVKKAPQPSDLKFMALLLAARVLEPNPKSPLELFMQVGTLPHTLEAASWPPAHERPCELQPCVRIVPSVSMLHLRLSRGNVTGDCRKGLSRGTL